jgi:hypothetical protein
MARKSPYHPMFKDSSPDTVAGSLANGTDVTISNKRRYPYNTHSANSHSITIKHLTNHPKVLDSRPDSATGNLALMELMLPFL